MIGKQNGWTVVELEVIDVSQEETLMPNPWVPYIRWTEEYVYSGRNEGYFLWL